MAISPGVTLAPSHMIILKEKIPRYNNILVKIIMWINF